MTNILIKIVLDLAISIAAVNVLAAKDVSATRGSSDNKYFSYGYRVGDRVNDITFKDIDGVSSVLSKPSTSQAGYIFKSLSPVSWVEEAQRVQALYTSRVSIADLPDDTALRAAPGIFQQAIPKKIEVRATFLGKKYIAAKIDSSINGRSHQDWRLGYYSGLRVEPYKLPDEVEALAVKFMDAMDLQYAAFDFILSEDGQWYFLEVNESGQFLWIEQYNPDIPMLKSFCDFLVGGVSWSPEFSLTEFDGNVAHENATCRLKIIV